MWCLMRDGEVLGSWAWLQSPHRGLPPCGSPLELLPGGKGKWMENKSSLETVEICLWENGGIMMAADHGTNQHSKGCGQPRTRGSQPKPIPRWDRGRLRALAAARTHRHGRAWQSPLPAPLAGTRGPRQCGEGRGWVMGGQASPNPPGSP